MEEIPDDDKMWNKCQQFFENVYITRKHHMDAEGQKQKNNTKIAEAYLHMYLVAMEAKMEQDPKEHDEHIKQFTEQNVILLELVQEQQKKIEDILMQSKTLMEAMAKETTALGMSGSTRCQTWKMRNW